MATETLNLVILGLKKEFHLGHFCAWYNSQIRCPGAVDPLRIPPSIFKYDEPILKVTIRGCPKENVLDRMNTLYTHISLDENDVMRAQTFPIVTTLHSPRRSDRTMYKPRYINFSATCCLQNPKIFNALSYLLYLAAGDGFMGLKIKKYYSNGVDAKTGKYKYKYTFTAKASDPDSEMRIVKAIEDPTTVEAPIKVFFREEKGVEGYEPGLESLAMYRLFVFELDDRYWIANKHVPVTDKGSKRGYSLKNDVAGEELSLLPENLRKCVVYDAGKVKPAEELGEADIVELFLSLEIYRGHIAKPTKYPGTFQFIFECHMNDAVTQNVAFACKQLKCRYYPGGIGGFLLTIPLHKGMEGAKDTIARQVRDIVREASEESVTYRERSEHEYKYSLKLALLHHCEFVIEGIPRDSKGRVTYYSMRKACKAISEDTGVEFRPLYEDDMPSKNTDLDTLARDFSGHRDGKIVDSKNGAVFAVVHFKSVGEAMQNLNSACKNGIVVSKYRTGNLKKKVVIHKEVQARKAPTKGVEKKGLIKAISSKKHDNVPTALSLKKDVLSWMDATQATSVSPHHIFSELDKRYKTVYGPSWGVISRTIKIYNYSSPELIMMIRSNPVAMPLGMFSTPTCNTAHSKRCVEYLVSLGKTRQEAAVMYGKFVLGFCQNHIPEPVSIVLSVDGNQYIDGIAAGKIPKSAAPHVKRALEEIYTYTKKQ